MDSRQRVERPCHDVGLEVQLGAYAADEARGRLEAERRSRERALLSLEQAGEVHLPARAQIVAGGETVDGRGGHGERGALLELRPYLGRPALEQRVGILELHLARRVVDRIVDVPREQAVAHVDPFAAIADLKTVERQLAPVGRGRDVGFEPQREHRGRPLGREKRSWRAVQRVVALRGGEPARVGERRQVREYREVVAQRRPLVGVARAGEQAVVLIELGGVRLQRHAEPREVRLTGRQSLFALVHREREPHGLAGDLAAADTVRAADLEPERRRGSRDGGLGVVDEPQRIGRRGRVGIGGDGERADAAPARAAGGLTGRDVGDREVVALVEPARECEPGAARVHVVILPLLQHLPLERAGALRPAVHGAGARRARHRFDAADVLVGARNRGHRAHAVDVQASHAQRVGERQLIDAEDVDGRIPGDERRIDGEEKPSLLVVQVARHAIERLGGGRAHVVHAVLDDVALLLGVNAAQLEIAELRHRLDAEVVRGDRRADEARARCPKGDVAGFDALQDVVLEAFVPDPQIVVRVELALAVEVDVDVQALPHDARSADRVLRHGTDGGEADPATRDRLLLLDRRTLQVLEPVRLELEPHVELHAQIRGRAQEAHRAVGGEGRRRERLGRGGRCRGRRRPGRGERQGGERGAQAPLPGCRYRGGAGVDAEATAGEERRMARHGERHPAKCGDELRRGRRVGTGGGARILRVGLGYDERESDETDQGGAPHPL